MEPKPPSAAEQERVKVELQDENGRFADKQKRKQQGVKLQVFGELQIGIALRSIIGERCVPIAGKPIGRGVEQMVNSICS